jgi:hypothetical protein
LLKLNNEQKPHKPRELTKIKDHLYGVN